MYRIKPQGWLKHLDFMVLDVFCLHIAFVLAYLTRQGLSNPYTNIIYLNILLVFTLVDVVVLIMNSTLKNVLKRGAYIEFAQTVKHAFYLVLIVSFYLFSTQKSAAYSRIVIYLFASYYVLLTYAVRLLWKKAVLSGKASRDQASLFVITTAERAERILGSLQETGKGQYKLSGICITDRDMTGETMADVPVCAGLDNVLEYLCREWVDEIYFSLPYEADYARELSEHLAEMGLVVHVELNIPTGEDWHKHQIERMADQTVLTMGMNFATTRQAVLKRSMDIIVGLIGCLITLLLTIILGPMIYIKSPGPIFFSHTRVGKNGKKFKMYKFRSMYPDAEERKAELMKENRVKDGMMFKLDYDPRIIGCRKLPDGTIKKGIGNYIREWSLDEFPQFLNVLIGQMSVCGTRPPSEDEFQKYKLHHRSRLAIKPGVTGLWQVSGRSNITDFEEVVKLDQKYIREWSMGLDFRIIFQTVKAVMGKEGSM